MLPRAREEKAIILDFLPNGYPTDTRPSHRKTAIALAIGKEHFSLLELVPKREVFLQPNQEVYIGDGKRDDIHHINGSITIDKLTNAARQELEHVVREIVDKNPQKYMEFFNKAGPISTRMHMLELLPGVGKKHMWEIIEARKEKPFENFNDIKNRVKLMPDPEKSIIKRILLEIEGEDKRKIFVR
jgi:putative nucleotide binding protein